VQLDIILHHHHYQVLVLNVLKSVQHVQLSTLAQDAEMDLFLMKALELVNNVLVIVLLVVLM